MRTLLVRTLVVLAWPAVAGSVQAQVIYEFANSSGVAQSSFSVALNGTVDIEVFLHDNSPNFSTTGGGLNAPAGGGLGTDGVRLRFDNPSGVAAVVNPTFGTNVFKGANWDSGSANDPTPTANSAVLGTASFSGV